MLKKREMYRLIWLLVVFTAGQFPLDFLLSASYKRNLGGLSRGGGLDEGEWLPGSIYSLLPLQREIFFFARYSGQIKNEPSSIQKYYVAEILSSSLYQL